jgi:hypothetical protein
MKKRFNRLIPLFALLLGVLGVVVCAAAIVVVWSTVSRLSRTNERVFDRIDVSLAAVRDRILGAQKRVQESKITTEDIGNSVRNWTQEKTSERIASRLEVEKKAAQLATDLRQADLWLETSEASILGVQQVFETASSLGAPVDEGVADTLLEKLGLLRGRLKQSTETADAIRENMAKMAAGETPDERISQVAQLALRIVATLGDIDTRLGNFAERLADTQTKGQNVKNKTHFYIVAAEISAVLFTAWMAAGQVFMCRHGWTNWLRSY